MIKSNELRIGNYITAKGAIDPFENYLTVCGLEEKLITTKYFSHEGQCWQIIRNKDNYIGIPLTGEWIIKLGSENKNQLYEIYPFEFYIDDFGECLMYFKGHNLSIFNYVHELQNIYFSITGKELEIKKQ